MLFKRFTAKALKSSDPSILAWTVSGLFSRLTLAGLIFFFISRFPAINFLVVLINFVALVSILLIWVVGSSLRAVDLSQMTLNNPNKTQAMKGGTAWSPLR